MHVQEPMDVIINCSRPGKGITRYIERLVDDNARRVKTINFLPPEFSRQWCEEVWWQNGCVPYGFLVGSVRKYLYKKEWFSIMELLDTPGNRLGFYIDIYTPMRENGGELYLTDLFLDLWVGPDGSFFELDRDEFEQAYQARTLSYQHYKKAQQVHNNLKQIIVSGEYLHFLE